MKAQIVFSVFLLVVNSVNAQPLNVANGNIQLDNGYGLYGKNTGGQPRQIFVLHTDNNVYLSSIDGAQSFRTGVTESERLRIAATGNITMAVGVEGNVGIGSSNPRSKLDVIGGMQVAGSIVQQWGDYENYIRYPDPYASDSTFAMGMKTSTSARRLFFDNKDGDSAPNGAQGGITFRTGGALTDRLHIAYNGNIGVGTTTPVWNLQVIGPSAGIRSDNTNATNLLIENTRPGGRAWGFAAWGDQSGGGAQLTGKFSIVDNSAGAHRVVIDTEGNVGIGTINPTQKLSVNGTVRAKEVVVETTGWSDYVFAENYKLQSLSELEQHIKMHKRLPGIPSDSEVKEKGIGLGEMQAKLLAKIEELALHQIRQEKQIEALQQENRELKNALRISTSPTNDR